MKSINNRSPARALTTEYADLFSSPTLERWICPGRRRGKMAGRTRERVKWIAYYDSCE